MPLSVYTETKQTNSLMSVETAELTRGNENSSDEDEADREACDSRRANRQTSGTDNQPSHYPTRRIVTSPRTTATSTARRLCIGSLRRCVDALWSWRQQLHYTGDCFDAAVVAAAAALAFIIAPFSRLTITCANYQRQLSPCAHDLIITIASADGLKLKLYDLIGTHHNQLLATARV